MSTASAQKGLWKLMLKLPALRGKLQTLSAHDTTLFSLCDAYDEASSMLERLQSSASDTMGMIAEYETLCSALEDEIISICIASETGKV